MLSEKVFVKILVFGIMGILICLCGMIYAEYILKLELAIVAFGRNILEIIGTIFLLITAAGAWGFCLTVKKS